MKLRPLVAGAISAQPRHRLGRIILGQHQCRPGDPQRQLAPFSQCAIDQRFMVGDARVDDAGDAVAIGMRHARPQTRQMIVKPEVRQPRHRPCHGTFMQHSRGLAQSIRHEVAIERVRCSLHQPHNPHRRAVQAGVVEGAVKQHCRAVGHRRVNHRSGQIVVAKQPRLPAGTQNQRQAGVVGGVGRHGPLQRSDGRHFIQRRRRDQIGAARQQMHMGILKPRQHQPAAGVDAVRTQGRRAAAQSGNPTALDQDPSGAGVCAIHGADIAIVDQ